MNSIHQCQFNLFLTHKNETEHKTEVNIIHSNLHKAKVKFKNIVQFALLTETH